MLNRIIINIIVPQMFRFFLYITGEFVIDFAGGVLRCDIHYPGSVFPRGLGFALNMQPKFYDRYCLCCCRNSMISSPSAPQFLARGLSDVSSFHENNDFRFKSEFKSHAQNMQISRRCGLIIIWKTIDVYLTYRVLKHFHFRLDLRL